MTDRTPMQRALDKDVQIEELARRVEVLEGALRPFDKIAGELFALNYNRADAVFSLIASPDVLRLKAGDFFDVRAALSTPSVGGSLAEENERLREALRSAKRLCDNIDEFGCVTDEEFYSVAERQIRAALGKDRT